MATLFAGIGSSILDGANTDLQAKFGVGEVVAGFANSIFILGFAFGPQVFGPLSEVLGRKWPMVFGIFMSSMFAIQTAGAGNLATLMLGRFLGGVFGAAPYAIGGGIFHDIYYSVHVQGGIAFFAMATAGGPSLGPIIGSGLSSTSDGYGWRWIGWFMVAFGITITTSLALFMEESYSPVILSKVADDKRHETGNWAWHSALDTIKLHPKDIMIRYVLRPVKMLFTEPMLVVISIYMSFLYALLYMLMAALPIIYDEMRGMSPVVATLPFLSVFIGIVFGGAAIIVDMGRYKKVLKARGVDMLPEQRFIPMGVGAVMLPIGLFWFSFSGPAQCASPWPSIIALGWSMCGMVLIFETGIIYIIDMYGAFANSALAANTLMRSLVGATFPLFTPKMVHDLGYKSTWAMAVLAFISLVMAGIPFVFYHVGARIRSMSKFHLAL